MSVLQLYLIFVKIGIFTFGGGFAMIPFFYDELVLNYGLMGSEEFANMVALAQVTPGPIGLNAATYIGYQQCGFWGAVAGTLGVTTPSLTIGLAVAAFLQSYKDNKILNAALAGIRPATLGLIAATVIFFAETSIFNAPLQNLWKTGEAFSINWKATIVFLAVFIAECRWRCNMLWLLLAAAIMSFILALI